MRHDIPVTASETHGIDVDASPQAAYAAVRAMDLARHPVARVLIALRGLGMAGRARRMDLAALQRAGFVLLEDAPPERLVLGLVARPWRVTGGIVRVPPAEFETFDRPGYAVIEWDFRITPEGDGARVVTETVIRCTDDGARARFRLYWLVVGPFSGLLRRMLLDSIKRDAESPAG